MEQGTVFIDSLDQQEKRLIISWPGHQLTVPLKETELRLGRSTDGNDIVVNYPVVSRYHATLRRNNGNYTIFDGQARNGQHRMSTNGLYTKGQRFQQRTLEHGDVITIPGINENFITLVYYDPAAAGQAELEETRLDQPVSIGRGDQNVLVLKDPTVSRQHARIEPTPRGHVLTDLNSDNGTYVNGRRIQNVQLQEDDIITIGSFQLRYDGQYLFPADLRREGIELEAISISRQVKERRRKQNDPKFKIIMQDVSIAIRPKEFVAIVGGSGTGKSTLLDALNGFRPASSGQVLINHDDLYDTFDAYRQSIGYVPQDDIIHLDLTVDEALRYVARLRLPPDIPDQEIEKRIDEALEQVAMLDKKTSLVKHLSGGQRKRVSISVELIADPGILFLDEPTSGLDPGLDKKMMFTLKQVANSGKTVILVTHATTNITDCDLVAFMAEGGRLVYYGPPRDALAFFRVEDFAEIYSKVEQEPDTWLQTYHESSYYDTYVKRRLPCLCTECGEPVETDQTECPHCGKSLNVNPVAIKVRKSKDTNQEGLGKRLGSSLRQFSVLTRRYLTMLFRDQRNLLFLLLQAPIIALLLSLVMTSGLFGKGINTNVDDIKNIQTTLFVLACVATWFGIINAAREIVKELPVYRRERLVNLSIPAYVFSKVAVLLMLSVVQAFLLVLIVALRAKFPADGSTFLPAPAEIYVTVLLVTLASVCFGLFLSSVAQREDRVMSVMPLFLIPQIVFAGIVFKLKGIAEIFSWFTFSRWGIEALGSSINLPELNKFASFSAPMDDLVYGFTHSTGYLFKQWAILLVFALFSILFTIIALKRQDVH